MKEELIKEIRDELNYIANYEHTTPILEKSCALIIAKSNLYIALATLVNK